MKLSPGSVAWVTTTIAVCFFSSAAKAEQDHLLKYGDTIYLQVNNKDSRWLTGSRGDRNEDVFTRNQRGSDYEISKGEYSYQWTIQSNPSDSTEKQGECLKFGDVIYLYQYVHGTWLSGSRRTGNEAVVTRDMFRDDYEQNDAAPNYQWIVRSNAGNGARSNRDNEDIGYGRCIQEFSVVYLQNNSRDNRWLTGGRGSGNTQVLTRNREMSSYEKTKAAASYTWTLRRTLGSGERTDALQCQVISSNGHWVSEGKYTNGQKSLTFTEGTTRTTEGSFEQTASWELSATASITTGFTFGEAELDVSETIGRSFTTAVSEAISITTEREFTANFGPGQVWRFHFTVQDLCVPSWEMKTLNLVRTDGDDEPPCCLPGYALDREHGPCMEGTPCSCSEDVCNSKVPDCRRLRGNNKN